MSSYGLNGAGKTIAALNDDARTLLDYGVTEDGYVIKVGGHAQPRLASHASPTDASHPPTSQVATSDATASSNLETLVENPNVQKFELTREEYEQRGDTVKAYKERNKIGRFADAPASQRIAAPFPPEFAVGVRVKVSLPPPSASSSSPFPGTFATMALPQRRSPSSPVAPPQDPKEAYVRLGTIRYLGPTKFGTTSSENWVGVEYDEPVGTNDGSVNGERFFSCRVKYGGFVKTERCEVGDWAAEDEDDEGLNTDDELGL